MWKKPLANVSDYRARMLTWRSEDSIVRSDKPLRIDKARRYGYKAKTGFVILRVRIRKGGRKREQWSGGRKPGNSGIVHFSTSQSLQLISEQRAQRKYPNLVVLGSYLIGDDGYHKYFELILVDPVQPNIYKHGLHWTLHKSKNASRGLTPSGRKSRGLVK